MILRGDNMPLAGYRNICKNFTRHTEAQIFVIRQGNSSPNVRESGAGHSTLAVCRPRRSRRHRHEPRGTHHPGSGHPVVQTCMKNYLQASCGIWTSAAITSSCTPRLGAQPHHVLLSFVSMRRCKDEKRGMQCHPRTKRLDTLVAENAPESRPHVQLPHQGGNRGASPSAGHTDAEGEGKPLANLYLSNKVRRALTMFIAR